MKNYFALLSLVCSILFFSCKENSTINSAEKKIFKLTDSSETGFFYFNEIKETEEMNALRYGYYYNGGGVGIGDINNDGLPDIYMVGNWYGGRLFLNKGGMKFEQITESAGAYTNGFTSGVTMADVNNDGWVDIYLSRSLDAVDSMRANRLFINNHNNTFTERAHEYGIADEGFGTHANFFDYDKDGDLDLYVLNHNINFANSYGIMKKEERQKEIANLSAEDYKKTASKFFKNNGNGTFTDITAQVGLKEVMYGLSATVADINMDGWPDLYCTSDFADKDHAYINDKMGHFTDIIDEAFGHISKNSMGSDIADFDNDGLPDIITLDMMAEDNYRQKQLKGNSPYDLFHMAIDYDYHCQVMRNCVQRNNGDGSFSEIGSLMGVSNTDWSWSPLFADFDNDGKKDLFISNGYQRDLTDMDYLRYGSAEIIKNAGGIDKVKGMDLLNSIPTTPIANYIFQNRGNWNFQNMSSTWGLDEKAISNGAVYADLDLDGDLEIIVNNYNTPAFLYENLSNEIFKDRGFINFVFPPEELSKLYGTKIKLYSDSALQYQELSMNRGYLSTVHPCLHFGLGNEKKINKVEITFPNNTIVVLDSIAINQNKRISLSMGRPGQFEINKQSQTLVALLQNKFVPNYIHQESAINDFKDEPLLEQAYSSRGPFASVADVNNDGLEDVFIGASAGFTSSLFFQTAQGTFIKKEIPDFEKDKNYEDGQAVFFDADGDNDLDLFVASASNEVPDSLLKPRLYSNDGKGLFIRDEKSLPDFLINAQAVATIDIENDGDFDIILGGNVKAKNFPMAYPSVLLKNTKGNFTLTDLPNKGAIGIVNDIAIADIDKNGYNDIILAGDWMPITIWLNKKASFENATSRYGLEKSSGMWNCISIADINKDGNLDILAGNRGENDFFKCSEKQPAVLYTDDFDKNGDRDAVINYFFNDGVLYPKNSLEEILQQMPAWRALFPNYKKYANTNTQTLFTKNEFPQMIKLECYNFSSGWFQNKGTSFSFHPFAIETQVSPLMGILTSDKYVFSGGNFYDVDVNIGRYDAFKAYVWDLTKNFTGISNSGFSPSGQVRDIKSIKLADGSQGVLCLSNNAEAQLYKIK